ncbi:hypothetical protein M3O96_00130 [Aquiflexum sp. TKW24L]|uniref:hypothetical protein n=1 Tax=Aquiflexum sp. TKW24L TaxID=2942212 RepID=UPI0020BF588D|nr:hypothetical protein [Aquiflexum sp. TKW24L]MCL6257476.1 hypothetical protein [Aquiflexum sp. TKW24L]
MKTPEQFNQIIKRHLNVFAAWMPIVSNYRLGDYGIISDGVFVKLGNITDDFQITFTEGSGAEASIDFTSEGARVIKFAGNAEVPVIPEGAVDAKVEIEFSNEKSFLVKSPTITVKTIENINQVADKLKGLNNWDGKWKVVYAVYNALDAVIVSTLASGTKLNFSGDASALGKLKLGSAGVNINTNKTLGLNINGKNGPIGLGLFRVKSKIFGGLKLEILSDEIEDEDDLAIILEPEEVTKDDL